MYRFHSFKTFSRDLLFSNPKDANDVPSEPVELQHVVSFQCLTDPLKQTQQGWESYKYILVFLQKNWTFSHYTFFTKIFFIQTKFPKKEYFPKLKYETKYQDQQCLLIKQMNLAKI